MKRENRAPSVPLIPANNTLPCNIPYPMIKNFRSRSRANQSQFLIRESFLFSLSLGMFSHSPVTEIRIMQRIRLRLVNAVKMLK